MVCVALVNVGEAGVEQNAGLAIFNEGGKAPFGQPHHVAGFVLAQQVDLHLVPLALKLADRAARHIKGKGISLCGFLPTKALGPVGQKPAVSICQAVFPACPRQFFHSPSAGGAIDTTPCVYKKHLDAQYGDKLEAASWCRTVLGGRSATFRANRAAIFAGNKLQFTYCGTYARDLTPRLPVDEIVERR